MVRWQSFVALCIGVSVGTCGSRAVGLHVEPLFSVLDPLSMIRLGGLLVLCFAAGVVTPWLTWKHTPGLPGMAFALSLFASRVAWNPTPTGVESETADTVIAAIESVAALVAVLVTYSLAWATDTYVVFRKLTIKPPPKQINSWVMLTKLLPCCILTGVIGGGFQLAFTELASPAIAFWGFAASGFVASRLLGVRSTLWYASAPPVTWAVISMTRTNDAALYAVLENIGLGIAGAIWGHWVNQILGRGLKSSPLNPDKLTPGSAAAGSPRQP